MTVSRIVAAVGLPAAHVQEALIADMQELAHGAGDLLANARTMADSSGKMLRPDRYVRDVRGMLGDAATMVQKVEGHASSLYGPNVGARQAGGAALAISSIDHDLAAYAGKDRWFGDTRGMGLDRAIQERIHAASGSVTELQAWTDRLVPRPPIPSRPPLATGSGGMFSAAPVGHAAQAAPHGMVAPPAAFSSSDAVHAGLVAPKGTTAPNPAFSATEALDTPVRQLHGAGQQSPTFSSPESTDTAVRARRGTRAAKLSFSSQPAASRPPRQAAGTDGAAVLRFQDGSL